MGFARIPHCRIIPLNKFTKATKAVAHFSPQQKGHPMHLRHLAAALTLAISSAYAAPQSWLQQNLPPQTTAYLRLPNLWFLENHKLAASAAYQNDAYRAQTSAVRSALIQRLITLLPEEARAPLQNLQQHLDAPLEIALIQDKNELNLLIAASAAFPDEQTLQQTLAQTFPAPWKVSAGSIEQRGAPTIAYRYDSSTQRLLLSTGLVKNPADNLKYLAEDGGDAPFAKLQERLDPSADGFYLWLDPQNPLLQQKLREYKPLLEKLGIDRAEQLALAWSVQNERPRLQISLIQPDNAPLNLPQATTDALKLPYQGDISALAALTLPNDTQIDGLADSSGKIKQTLQQALGISADDLAALGTIHYLADDNGSYLVLPQSTKAALDALLTKLQDRGILNKRETLQDGIEHLAFTSLAAQGAKLSEQDNVFKKSADTAFNTLMSQLQNHYYLRAEGDYLLISDLPQPLLARKNLAADAPTIADWLAKEHLDIQHSNYAYIQNQRHLSRDSYYNSLKRLQAYADLAQSPLDIMALPDASQLPASGAVALRLHGRPPEHGGQQHHHCHLRHPLRHRTAGLQRLHRPRPYPKRPQRRRAAEDRNRRHAGPRQKNQREKIQNGRQKPARRSKRRHPGHPAKRQPLRRQNHHSALRPREQTMAMPNRHCQTLPATELPLT